MIMILAVIKNVAVTGERYVLVKREPKTSLKPRRWLTRRSSWCPTVWTGERVDAAVARMLGLSRSRIADLIAAGLVLHDGSPVSKSDRVRAGVMLEVEFDERVTAATVMPQLVPGIRIVHDDDDIVVIDKPAGRRRTRVSGWQGSRRARPSGRRRLPDLHLRCAGTSRHRAAVGRRHLGPDGRREERDRVHANALILGTLFNF